MGNRLTSNLLSTLDSTLMDIAQIHGVINYDDILIYAGRNPTRLEQKSLLNECQEFLEAVEDYEEYESRDNMRKSLAGTIKSLSNQIRFKVGADANI